MDQTRSKRKRKKKKQGKKRSHTRFLFPPFLIWHFCLVISPRGNIVARVSRATRSTDPQLFKTPRQRPQKYLSARAMLSQTSFTRRYFPLQFRNHVHIHARATNKNSPANSTETKNGKNSRSTFYKTGVLRRNHLESRIDKYSARLMKLPFAKLPRKSVEAAADRWI